MLKINNNKTCNYNFYVQIFLYENMKYVSINKYFLNIYLNLF